ncbi:MAG TPA: hypothetical protein VN622_10430 [Clostridia bacterium]|nr:hypothetical protein [Clostridia bacterium]
MAVSKQSRLTHSSMGMRAIFVTSENAPLILSLAVVVVAVLYFVALYAMAG